MKEKYTSLLKTRPKQGLVQCETLKYLIDNPLVGLTEFCVNPLLHSQNCLIKLKAVRWETIQTVIWQKRSFKPSGISEIIIYTNEQVELNPEFDLCIRILRDNLFR